jgi:hypothetical protein
MAPDNMTIKVQSIINEFTTKTNLVQNSKKSNYQLSSASGKKTSP